MPERTRKDSVQAFVTTPPAYQSASAGTTATEIFAGTGTTLAGSAYTFPVASENSQLIVQNSGTATVYLGQSGVTASTGVPVPPGESAIVPATVGTASTFALYGITAAGSSQVEAGLASVIAEA